MATGRLRAAFVPDVARPAVQTHRVRRTVRKRSVLAGNLCAASCPTFTCAPFSPDVAAESGFSYHRYSGVPFLSGRIRPACDAAAAKRRAERALKWPSKPFGPNKALPSRKTTVGEPRFCGSISPHRPTPVCLGPSCPPHRPAPALGSLPAHARVPRRPCKTPVVLSPRALCRTTGTPPPRMA